MLIILLIIFPSRDNRCAEDLLLDQNRKQAIDQHRTPIIDN